MGNDYRLPRPAASIVTDFAWAALEPKGHGSEAKMGPAREDEAMATKTESPIGQAQKRPVQTAFAQVEPIAEAAAELFYDELFELDPERSRAAGSRPTLTSS